MRYYLRLILVALLSLALPLSAFADVGSSKRCVLKVNGIVISMSKDCCDPVKEKASHLKQSVCKAGQECNSIQNYPPISLMLDPSLPAPAGIDVGWKELFVSSLLLDALWRPPRSPA